MKQTMKWLFDKDEGESVVLRCSVCNSEITVKYGEELPYCKHCENEPDEEQFATGNKMTDNEIIKALNECLTEPCGIQSFIYAVRNALDLITRQKEQIEALIAGQETLQKYIAEKDAEIEKKEKELVMFGKWNKEYEDEIYKLRKSLLSKENLEESFSKTVKQFDKKLEKTVRLERAEAVKECLEWVLSLFPEDKKFTTISRFTIKQKLKEMVGEG